MSSDHQSISFETGLTSFEGANNKFIHITLDKTNDVSNNVWDGDRFSHG